MGKSCTDCYVQKCAGKEGNCPDFCPMNDITDDGIEDLLARYNDDEENHTISLAAAMTEEESYGRNTRVEDTIDFAKKIGAKKIGIATCIGLISESRILSEILRSNGFEVMAVCCKIGAIDKSSIGMEKISSLTGRKMCNPILQAEILNKEEMDLDIVMGLCVGHDSLFYKYAKGPVTTLVSKDRVTGHNPAAPLYTYKSYYKKLLQGEEND